MTGGTYTSSDENENWIKGRTWGLVGVETLPAWRPPPRALEKEDGEFLVREANGGDDHAEA